MAGYFGTEDQKRLQARAEESAPFIAATPGACQNGRTIGCDDPDLFGWDRIEAVIRRDGVCGFRLLPSDRLDGVVSRLSALGCRLDTWDVFLADRATALAACKTILARPLPAGLGEADDFVDPEGDSVRRFQALASGAGLVPFSGSLLTGACGPATTVAIADEARNTVATAHAYLPHNAHSQYRRYAWGGLVAVSEAVRGMGLGTWINARMVVNAFQILDATHIYELVSATNTPSRRMVEACGLRADTTLICGAAMPHGRARYTR